MCGFLRRSSLPALFLAAISLAGNPAHAAETLYARFFWRAPPGATPEQSLVITAGAAYPDGGLAVAGYRGDPFDVIERSIYRIDSSGRTIWELDLGPGRAAVGTLVRDSRDGLVFCDDRDKVRRVDSSGRPDWTVAGWWPPPVDPRYPTTTNGIWDCDRLLVLADGSVIAATVVDQGYRTVLQLARIGAGGTIMWSTSIGDLWYEGRVAALLALPGGTIEILINPQLPRSNERPIPDSSPDSLQWRISADGRGWYPIQMHRLEPLAAGWRGFAALYRQGDRLVLVANPYGEECRQPFEEWSLDGNHRLAEGYFPSLGVCTDDGTDTGIEDPRSALLAPRDMDPDFLASLPTPLHPVWYRLPPGVSLSRQYRSFQVPRDVRLPLGKRLFLFGEPDEIYVAEFPLPER